MANHPEFLTIGANLVMRRPRVCGSHAMNQKYSNKLLRYCFLKIENDWSIYSDMSDASGTLWLDVAKRDWSDELLAATNLTREQMPSLVEGAEKVRF